MSRKYNLKLSPIIKQIVDIYNEVDPLQRYNAASAYLRPYVYKEINRILDELESRRKKEADVDKVLKKEGNKDILELLDKEIRF